MFIKVLIDKYGQTVTEGLQAVMHQRHNDSIILSGETITCVEIIFHIPPPDLPILQLRLPGLFDKRFLLGSERFISCPEIDFSLAKSSG